eukprot:UN32806
MSAENFGMMSGAYFVGKSTLIQWVNNFLAVQIKKVEEMSNGAMYCQLLDALYADTINMRKVDFGVKSNHDILKNWKIIQGAFDKNATQKKIPINRIIQGRFQDNLEFMQWFYQYFQALYRGDQYDAIERRAKSKGIKNLSGGSGRGGRNNVHQKMTNNYTHSRTKSSMVGKTNKQSKKPSIKTR